MKKSKSSKKVSETKKETKTNMHNVKDVLEKVLFKIAIKNIFSDAKQKIFCRNGIFAFAFTSKGDVDLVGSIENRDYIPDELNLDKTDAATVNTYKGLVNPINCWESATLKDDGKLDNLEFTSKNNITIKLTNTDLIDLIAILMYNKSTKCFVCNNNWLKVVNDNIVLFARGR